MSVGHPPPASFEAYDDLGRDERESLLRHASECADCRRRLVAGDPARTFAFLALRPLPETALERVSEEVRRRIDSPVPSAARGGAWAAIAASLLLAAVLSSLVLRRPDAIAPSAATGTPFGSPPAFSAGTDLEAQPGAIELLSPADADIYDLAIGETRIVMIFDAEIDL